MAAVATDNTGLTTTSATVNIVVNSATNIPPTVSISAPANNSSFIAPASVTINVTATDAGGTISKVEFFQGTTKLGEDQSSPYQLNWNNVEAGRYVLTAVATDNGGAVTTSSPVSIIVGITNTPPTVTISSPLSNAAFTSPALVVINATANDAEGTVTKVEFFQGTSKLGEDTNRDNGWSFSWANVSTGNYSLTARATDNENASITSSPVNIIVNRPPDAQTSIFLPSEAPTGSIGNDGVPLQLGMKFRSSVSGYVTGVRFYKQAGNTGTHLGQLYNSSGTLLAQATFINETASGWQEVAFPDPVAITANITYIISYHSSAGFYSYNTPYFTQAKINGSLRGLANGEDGSNGVYRYSSTPAFPSDSYQASNYWVDVVYTTSVGSDNTPPAVASVLPVNNATGVNEAAPITVTFSEAVDPSTVSTATFELLNGSATMLATVSYNASSRTASLIPAVSLTYSTTYIARAKGGSSDPSIKDLAGNALANTFSWSFTTRSTPPPPPPPPPSVNDGLGGPILVISSPTHPFSRYAVEILRAEGLNEFAAKHITEVSLDVLNNYDVIVLGEFPLTAAQVTMFTNWVNEGGILIAFKPDVQLASLLGITKVSGSLTDRYLLVNTASEAGAGIVNQTIQFHGPADLYTLNGATRVATLYSNATTVTINPAVTTRNVGSNGGKAIAFTYDLARSIILTRQGNPSWAGQKRDGEIPPIRSDDMFYPDWIDFSKVAIPQADEQQRLLANLIIQGNLAKKPLPRFWYLPRGLKAAVIMTGDDHATGGTLGRFNHYISRSPSNSAQAVQDWTAIRSTSYIYPGTGITNAQAADFESKGFEISLHLNTNCESWTATSLRNFFNQQLPQLAAQLPSIAPPVTHRTHCMAWSDWASKPKVQLERGIRFDVNYYYWPEAWLQNRPGMFTGSGMPMRIADLDGSLIDCYQGTTQLTDESGINYSTHINTLLDNALGANGYYGVFTTNMHTDQEESAGSEAIINAALARQVPVISAKQMLTWLDGRNNSSFNAISWNDNELSFQINAANGSYNLRAMLPVDAEGSQLSEIEMDGTTVSFTTETIKGITYAFFPATEGSYLASYTPIAARKSSEQEVEPTASLQVYPNPSMGEALQVEAQGLQGGEELRLLIYNPLGVLIGNYPARADEEGNLVQEVRFIHKLSSGMYTLILQGKTNILRQKVLIAR